MKRAISGILIFLILGLSTAITIAWFGALNIANSDQSLARIFSGQPGVVVSLHKWPLMTRITANKKDALYGVKLMRYSAPPWSECAALTTEDNLPAIEVSAGWPMRCVQWVTYAGPDDLAFVWNHDTTGGLPVRYPLGGEVNNFGHWRVLPYTPIWPGLIANTLFFAVLWFIPPTMIVIGLRQYASQRIARNICPKCKYMMKGVNSDCCPECGTRRNARPAIWSMKQLRIMRIFTVCLIMLLLGAATFLHIKRPRAPLHFASSSGDVDRLRELLNNGASPDEEAVLESKVGWGGRAPDIYTPLMIAAMKDEVEAARLLLEAGADPNAMASQKTSMHFACAYAGPEMIRLLAEHGADPNLKGTWFWSSPLDQMIFSDNLRSLDALIEAGLDFSKADSALSTAYNKEQYDLFRTLLEHGAPPTFEVLSHAVQRFDAESLDLLVEYGADLTGKSAGGSTLLHSVWGYDRENTLPIAQRILAAGVDVDAKGANGVTALMLAVFRGQECVELILEHNPDPTPRNNFGFTALEYAKSDTVRALIQEALDRWEVNHPDTNENDDEAGDNASALTGEDADTALNLGDDPNSDDNSTNPPSGDGDSGEEGSKEDDAP